MQKIHVTIGVDSCRGIFAETAQAMGITDVQNVESGSEMNVMILRDYISDIHAELICKADNAARRKKPTMWAYYLRMAEHISSTYRYAMTVNHDAILDCARQVEQHARRMCLTSMDATYGDKALWYAYSVYARRIMRYAGHSSRGWVSLWLRPSQGQVENG
jgi:hypothetical protein